MAEQPTSPQSAAPAEAPPESTQEPQVQLGPHTDIYPESVKAPQPALPPAETSETDAPEAPEGEDRAAPVDAGPEPSETRGSRRKGADAAYQRGLSEGREALAREQADNYQRQQAERIQQEANQRVQQLMDGLKSPDRLVRDRSGAELAQIFDSNRAGQAALASARQDLIQEMARGFDEVRQLDGVDDAAMQQLLGAPRAVDLAKAAYGLGQKAQEAKIAALEAELQAARARMVGQAATPERANGAGQIGQHSFEDMQRLGPKEFAQLPKAQYDAAVRAYLADKAAGRT